MERKVKKAKRMKERNIFLWWCWWWYWCRSYSTCHSLTLHTSWVIPLYPSVWISSYFSLLSTFKHTPLPLHLSPLSTPIHSPNLHSLYSISTHTLHFLPLLFPPIYLYTPFIIFPLIYPSFHSSINPIISTSINSHLSFLLNMSHFTPQPFPSSDQLSPSLSYPLFLLLFPYTYLHPLLPY